MRLAYLSGSVIPSRTANSIHVMKMCQALALEGHDVTLFAPNIRQGVEEGVTDSHKFYGVQSIFAIRKIWWSKWLGRAYTSGLLAALYVVSNKFDAAIARCLPSAFFTALFGVPVSFEYHQPISDSGRLSLLNELIFRCLIRRKSFVRLVVITHALKAQYLQRYPSLADRIHVAPDGADPFQSETPPVSLGEGRLQVGYVGQLYPGKGMEIISKLAPLAPLIDFHVVGGLRADIEKWQAKLAGTNISFHGFVPHAETAAYIAAFDAVLLPNQKRITWHKAGGDIGQWTSPLKMFEYMSAGKAIVSSDLPVLKEVLQHEHNALLCAPDDIDAWAAALTRLEDKAFREKLGAQALSDFTERYTWQRRAQQILALFERLRPTEQGDKP